MSREFVRLSHGAGGRETAALLERLVLSRLPAEMKTALGGIGTDELDDGATILAGGQHVVISIDSYTVSPPFFPGGDIGKLAACGSINDVLMMGGKPVAMLDAIVTEEGFPLTDLEKIVESFVSVLREEGVSLIGGDLKVMPKDQLDGVLVTTACLGLAKRPIVDSRIKPGDAIVVTGTVGEHGAAIMAAQRGISVEAEGLISDVQPLTKVMLPLLEEHGESIRAAQDPTRSGVAGALNEWAQKSGTVIVVDGPSIPIREEVRVYCEMLGVDPLVLACEGRALLAVDPSALDDVLCTLKELGCEDAAAIGEVRESERFRGIVLLRTEAGGLRILERPSGVIVPRIC